MHLLRWKRSLLALLVCACAADEVTSYRVIKSISVGETANGYVVGAVFEDRCLSGCSVVESAQCAASVENFEITVSGSALVRTPNGEGDCPTACVQVVASCDIGVLEPGTYTIRYAVGKTETLVVP